MAMATKSWGVEEVSSWLTQVGFPQLVDGFREQEVDGEVLLQLTPLESNSFGDVSCHFVFAEWHSVVPHFHSPHSPCPFTFSTVVFNFRTEDLKDEFHMKLGERKKLMERIENLKEKAGNGWSMIVSAHLRKCKALVLR